MFGVCMCVLEAVRICHLQKIKKTRNLQLSSDRDGGKREKTEWEELQFVMQLWVLSLYSPFLSAQL